MPLIRKIVKVGNSRGICLPSDWLKYLEQKEGERLKLVAIEINEKLLVKPIFEGNGGRNG